MRAVPLAKDSSVYTAYDSNSSRRRSHGSGGTGDELLFGGHPPPNLDVPYQVTSRDKKDNYHAICMMKAYENYSFEELRYASPTVHHPTETMMVRYNNDGTYSASWTPNSVGWYNIQLSIDGTDTGNASYLGVCLETGCFYKGDWSRYCILNPYLMFVLTRKVGL